MIRSQDAEVRTLDGAFEGTVQVVASAERNALVLDGDGVTLLDQSSAYQWWLVGPSGARSVGTFRPDESGHVRAHFDQSDPAGSIIGVTVEPAAGSVAPTTPIIAMA
ncbi:MAG: anti-sigma-K factor RskA [Ilumatobacter sp.]